MDPTERRSSASAAPAYFFATWATSRRLCSISFSRAAESPARAAARYFFSSSGGSGFGKLVPERMLEQKKTTFDKTNNSDSQNITHPFILTLSVYAGFCPDRRGGLYESVAFSAKICYHFPGKGKTL